MSDYRESAGGSVSREAAPGQPGIVRSAALLSLGNVTSRVLGLVREQVISYFFGAGVHVSSFRLSDRVLRLLYDLVVGGMLSGALVPVFSEYAQKDRDELWRLASALMTLIALIVASIILVIEVFALPLAHLLAAGQTPTQQQVTAHFFRLMAPAVFLLSMSSVLLAILYALKRFRFAALATAVYNLGIVVGVPLLAHRFDAFSLALGVLLGGTFQLLVLLPDLRDVRLRLSFYWQHPGLRRIFRLYLPVAVALLVGMAQGLFDGRLATFTGPSSLAYMANATTLVQFPLGLVAMAMSYASLPTLAEFAVNNALDRYSRTLEQVLRLVLFLSIPAAVGLFVLAEPVVRLVFEHGAFTPQDTLATARALRVYAIGLTFAAVDWPLNYGYYARQNTLTPTLVGLASVGVYGIVALTLMGPLGMIGLVWGDTAKHFSHAMTMTVLTRRDVGRLGRGTLPSALVRMALVAAFMGGVTWALMPFMSARLAPWGKVGELVAISVSMVVGGGIYVLGTRWLGLEESRLIWHQFRQRI